MPNSWFPTFCHISEFRDRGYARLDTMIALSCPLTLWSPSWNYVNKHSNEQINPDLLCKWVEQGKVRIAGRDFWINNGPRRQQRAREWDGAQWTKYDERIKQIAIADKNLRPADARVQITDAEDGYQRAEMFLNEHPEAVPSISRLVTTGKVPAGTLERIEQNSLAGFQAAREVLRDARNHGRAISDTGAAIPFLSLEYGEFMRLINEIDDPLPVTITDRRVRSMREVAEKTHDLLDDLAVFGQTNLDKFLGSDAHKELACWMADISEVAKDRNVSDIERLILGSLHRDIDRNFPNISIANLKTIYETSDLTDVLSSIFELLAYSIHPNDQWHLGGALFVALRMGHALLVRFDFAPPHYRGMNWLFLYVFGRKPRLGEIDAFRSYLARRLKHLQPS